MIKKARQFAMDAHGQQQYGKQPYIIHLEAVVNNLEGHGEYAQVVGYLHDVIEDTQVTYQDVKNTFGEYIADCVAVLTDEPGVNRKERKTKTYAKMAEVVGDLELALIVKAADRLANIQACLDGEHVELLNVYKDEHEAFYNAVYRKDLCEDIWEQILDAIDR